MILTVGTATYKFAAYDGTEVRGERVLDGRASEEGGRWMYILDHATQIA